MTPELRNYIHLDKEWRRRCQEHTDMPRAYMLGWSDAVSFLGELLTAGVDTCTDDLDRSADEAARARGDYRSAADDGVTSTATTVERGSALLPGNHGVIPGGSRP